MYKNISDKIINLIDKKHISKPKLTFLCIGTDRVIGDSLGPIVGSNIEKFISDNKINNIKVIGSLESNLNNTNIEEYTNNSKDITIVIDSAISNTYDIGQIIVDENNIKVRDALNDGKSISSNINIKCIVGKNFENEDVNFLMLQNVKLGIVLDLAQKVTTSIYDVIENYKN